MLIAVALMMVACSSPHDADVAAVVESEAPTVDALTDEATAEDVEIVDVVPKPDATLPAPAGARSVTAVQRISPGRRTCTSRCSSGPLPAGSR